jgi:hypothetical protein
VSRSQYDAETREQYKVLELLGSVENVSIAEYVYWYLWRELPMLWDVYAKGSSAKGRASRRSYYLGVLNGFHEKLSREKDKAQARQASEIQEGQSGQSLLVLDKSLERILKQELKGFVSERFPRLNRGGSNRSGLEQDAYYSGVAKGQTLELRQGITSNSRQLALSTGRN